MDYSPNLKNPKWKDYYLEGKLNGNSREDSILYANKLFGERNAPPVKLLWWKKPLEYLVVGLFCLLIGAVALWWLSSLGGGSTCYDDNCPTDEYGGFP